MEEEKPSMDPFAVEIDGTKYRLGETWSCLHVSTKWTKRKSYIWVSPNGTRLTSVSKYQHL